MNDHMNLSPHNASWDVIVIGGGPAGMMAAGRAAERGARVLLLEKNQTLGVKLLLTGGGRCNLTNATFDDRALLARYGKGGEFLFSSFVQFGTEETIGFFNRHGMATKVEPGNRVFPFSDSARSVLEVLTHYLREGGVEVRSGAAVEALLREENAVVGVRLASGEEIRAGAVVLAAGGASRPETGSSGDAFAMLRALGVAVNTERSALVPVAVKEEWVKDVQGISLDDAKATVFVDGKKELQGRGKLLFTHFGLSGPLILKMSRSIGELLSYGSVVIRIDLMPQREIGALREFLHELLRGEAINKTIKNALATLMPSALVDVVLATANTAADVPCHSVTREQRHAIAEAIKGLPLSTMHLLGLEKAIVSSGGIDLLEVDQKTMRVRSHDGLYVVGDVLDIDRPSGGFSLQVCWTTGWVAGNMVPCKV